MAYEYRAKPAPVIDDEAHIRAKFEFYRNAEATINAGPAKVTYWPQPIRPRHIPAPIPRQQESRLMKPLTLTIYDKHPDADAYNVGGFYSPYCLVGADKRFRPGELAAEWPRQ